MSDIRMSLRFREDNPLDMRAWERLKKLSRESNTSKNAVIIAVINEHSEDALAGSSRIEDKLDEILTKLEEVTASRPVVFANNTNTDAKTQPEADGPILISKSAFEFMECF